MSANKIDDLIENIINDFYTNIIKENKELKKIYSEINFIKSQNIINDILDNYFKTIPDDIYKQIVKNENSIIYIQETTKRYVTIYLFLTIGMNYKGNDETFINNIIEIIRNQKDYSFKVDNLFNADGSSLIIKLYYMGMNILKVYGDKDTTKTINKTDNYSEETIKLLDTFDKETLANFFSIKKLDKDVSQLINNIIFFLIILSEYKTKDKKKLYDIVEQSEISKGEYIFIDIVEPVNDIINFTNIENVLNKYELQKGIAYDIWDYLTSIQNSQMETKFKMNVDDKINILFNSGLIVPIIDDFMLYNKNAELYDNKIVEDDKKKNDTRMKYIINKIEATSELYNTKNDEKAKEKIIKNFSSQLLFRKAILRNNFEEYKIINKLLGQGKRNAENEYLLNDLINYRRYTYINFKDIEKVGFSNNFSKSVTSVRAVNFEKNVFKQNNSNNLIQIRVGAKDTSCNIVGLCIPSKPVQCVRLFDTIDITEIQDTKNKDKKFNNFVSVLKQNVFKDKVSKKSVYWIFDDELTNENVKPMIAEIYDILVKEIYYEMIDELNILNKDNKIQIDEINNTLRLIEKKLKIPIEDNIRKDIETYLFTKYIKQFDKKIDKDQNYVIESNIIRGIEGDIVKLPRYEEIKEEKTNRALVDLSFVDTSGTVIIKEKINGVCQHNITWENVKQQRNNYTLYLSQLYAFIQQYVVLDTNEDYICKSCGHYMDIDRYVNEGYYDSTKGYITYSMPMDVLLEDIPEYSNLQFTLKIMDKNIEKLASATGISYYTGNSVQIKWRRKDIVKNSIDMINENYKYFTKNWKEYNETKNKLYGVSYNSSNLFIFTIDDNIYKTSSKDKDQEKYKILKKNNIIAYMLIFLIFELNETQIMNFTTDKVKICDIEIFDSVREKLFAGLRIKKNNTNETVDINKYKILCYMLYIISCRIVKYRLWHIDAELTANNKNIKKLLPLIQKYIIHTCVDIINATLMNSYQKGCSYKYEIFRVKFFDKLEKLFKDEELYNIILGNNKYFTSERKKITAKNTEILPKQFIPTDRKMDIAPRIFADKNSMSMRKLMGVSNLSNCNNGSFHKWELINNTDGIKCKLCGVLMRDYNYDDNLTNTIINKYSLSNFAKIICIIDGKLHDYQGKELQCNKCNKKIDHDYSQEDIKIIENYVNNSKVIYEKQIKNLININKEYEKKEYDAQKEIQDIVNLAEKNNDEKISALIKLMQSFISNDISDNTKLYNNIYIIDHDHYGKSLDNPIIITDDDNKNIKYKKSHTFFNTDVLYYTNNTGSRVDVFYSSITNKLLGYKEASKDFVLVDSDKKLKINLSLFNKIKYMGYTGMYINANNYKYYDKINTKEIINYINIERNENIKKAMLILNTIITKIVYQTEKRKIINEQDNDKLEQIYFDNEIKNIIMKYSETQKKFILEKSNAKFFDGWNKIIDGVFYTINKDEKYEENINILNVDDIMKYDRKTSNLVYYICDELIKLINFNNDKFIKITLCNIIVDSITHIFSIFNKDNINTNTHTIKFSYILKSTVYAKEMVQDIMDKSDGGFYEEYIDTSKEMTDEDHDRMIDAEEENEALDADQGGEEEEDDNNIVDMEGD